MKRNFWWLLPALALSLVQIGSAQAEEAGAAAPALSQGARVVVVGPVSQPFNPNTSMLTVTIGPDATPYTLHVTEPACVVDAQGQVISFQSLSPGTWVRAEGVVMEAPAKIHLTQLQALGSEQQARSSEFFMTQFPSGYVMQVAGVREEAGITPAGMASTGMPSQGQVLEAGAIEIVGKVKEDTGTLETTRRLLVQAGDQTWRIDVPDEAAVSGTTGEQLSIHEIHEGAWVRARGLQTENLRVKADTVQEIATAEQGDQGYFQSAFFRPGYERGYVIQVAGVREQLPAAAPPGVVTPPEPFAGAVPLEIVGKVKEDTGLEITRRLLVDAGGQTWRVKVVDDALVTDPRGKPISVHEVHRTAWIHATGWQTGDKSIRATVVHEITEAGPMADQQFQQTAFYRPGFETGYITRVAGVRELFQPIVLTGTVTRVDRDGEWFILRTPEGRHVTVYVEGATFTRMGQPFVFRSLRVGDRATVTGRTVGTFEVPGAAISTGVMQPGAAAMPSPTAPPAPAPERQYGGTGY
ncbi:MAG: hypothetical protein HY320_12915 [Armatimonadetes bacterium]|nr:hypothetical protein [Armatimonadota bacterium]